MIDDVFRDRTRSLAGIEEATRAHLVQIHTLAASRRLIMIELVDLARAQGVKAPQAYVAAKLGISQQTVSKIINRK